MNKITNHPLPGGWRWTRLGDVCQVNPCRPSTKNGNDERPTTFVPMSSIDERSGIIACSEVRTLGEVRRGYTCFADGDVLFAKITPCMQNGKHAIAHDLIGGIGFGTTELHVIRPSPEVTPEWIHHFVRQPTVLGTAALTFTGSAGQQRVPETFVQTLPIPLPPLPEQKRIVAILDEQMAAVERARAAAEAQLELARRLVDAYLLESLSSVANRKVSLSEALVEVRDGVGPKWSVYPVIGATRAGAAPAKERPGKTPERYKLVDAGTVFYNPMRILLGSIGMVDEGELSGVTSPDYVVFKTRTGLLHHRWFYHWLRSEWHGVPFIKGLARGAVRERMLFRRLASAQLVIPPWDVQLSAANKLSHLTRLRMHTKDEIEIMNRLPASLLRRAFRGEL